MIFYHVISDEVLGPLFAGVELNESTARSRVSSRAISNPERVEVWTVPTEWQANKISGGSGFKGNETLPSYVGIITKDNKPL